MSHLQPEALTYENVVAEYFLALRGAGLMLSPLDLEQVRSWERRGIPVAVVCLGLRHGLEQARAGDTPATPRSLRRYRLCVEDEWRAYRTGRVGDAPAPPDETTAALRRLEAARGLVATSVRSVPPADPRRAAYGAAAEALRREIRAPTLEHVDAILADADAALLRTWLRTLPSRERTALGARCQLRAGPRSPWTRRVEHRALLRAHVLDAAREAGLLCLRGSV